MAYLAKSTVLKAYQLLSDIDSDKRQGLTQKVSALKYASALDIYFKMHNQNCDLKQSSNRDLFASYVGEIVKINDEYCTKDFFLSVSSNGRDFDCGSNFFSQTSVKDSKTNPYTVFLYPKRSGWQPVMDVQNQELIYRSDYFLDIFSFYLGSSELRLAFIIWILRFAEIAENNEDGIKSALNNIFTSDYCDALYTDSVNFVDNSYIEFDEEMCELTPDDIQSLFNAHEELSCEKTILTDLPLQTIFYGAPGTGKSHKVKEVTDTLPKSDVFRTTFHPDSDYSTFVGCYKPKMVKAPIRDGSGHEITTACEDEKKRIAYEYEPQAFLKAYVRACETSDPVFLVIEEINRGNCAQIFGDMFQLLDRNENGESDYAIKPETAIQEFLNDKLKDCDIADETIKSGEEMRLPTNLHIWATMNTSDQSLFPIDSAFKRRWDWKYVPIKRADNEPENKWIIKVTHGGKTYWCYWWEFLEAINHQIEEMSFPDLG